MYASCWYERRCAAEIRGRYKAITHFDKRPAELYDLAVDPGERTDLARSTDGATKTRADALLTAAKRRIETWMRAPSPRYERQAGAEKWAMVPVSDVAKKVGAKMALRAGGALELEAVQVDAAVAKPGQRWRMNTWLKCSQPPPPGTKVQMVVQLRSIDGQVHSAGHALQMSANGACPQGRRLVDPIELWVPAAWPAGRAEVWWGVRSSPKTDAGKGAKERPVRVVEIDVLPQYKQPLLGRFAASVSKTPRKLKQHVGAVFGGALRLDSVHIAPTRVPLGTNYVLQTSWEVIAPVRQGWVPQLHVRDALKRHYGFKWYPVSGTRRFASLDVGDWLHDQHNVFIDTGWPRGKMQLAVGLLDGAREVPLSAAPTAVNATSARVPVGAIVLH